MRQFFRAVFPPYGNCLYFLFRKRAFCLERSDFNGRIILVLPVVFPMKSIKTVIALIILLPLGGCVDKILETESVPQEPEPDTQETAEAIPEVDRNEILATRSATKGKLFATLTIAGNTYESATVTDIDDHGVKLRHTGGISVISWNDTAPKVKEAWGFDAAAHARIVRQEENKRKQLETFGDPSIPTEEELAALAKVQRQETEAANEERFDQLSLKLVELNAELRRGQSAITRMTENLEEIKEEYKKEDHLAGDLYLGPEYDNFEPVKGVKTSKHDRNKKLNAHSNQLSRARNAVSEIRKQIELVEYELSKLRKTGT